MLGMIGKSGLKCFQVEIQMINTKRKKNTEKKILKCLFTVALKLKYNLFTVQSIEQYHEKTCLIWASSRENLSSGSTTR